jgi:hypothetical protein
MEENEPGQQVVKVIRKRRAKKAVKVSKKESSKKIIKLAVDIVSAGMELIIRAQALGLIGRKNIKKKDKQK